MALNFKAIHRLDDNPC